jgi:anti-sigma regulatory factor (Ser/Thr protein kinase)
VSDVDSGAILELELRAVPESTSTARHVLRAFAGRFVADLTAVEVAVSEAVANVVLHAYRDRPEEAALQWVKVRASVDADSVCVSVTDQGLGFAPRVDSPGGGLGLSLIAALASHVEIDSPGTGMRVRMRFPRDCP